MIFYKIFCKKVMEHILKDSIFLSNLYDNEVNKDEFIKNNPEIEENFNIVYPIYEGIYPMSIEDLLKSITSLSFLSCIKKLQELLVILKYEKIDSKILINTDLINSYNLVKLETTVDKTYIKYGMLDYLKFLYSKDCFYPKDVNFYHTCKYGNIEIAEWLLSTNKLDLSIEFQYKTTLANASFKIACEYGNLGIVQYLISTKIIKFDMQNYRYLIRDICIQGNIELLQWLYETFEIDKKYLGVEAFKAACEFNSIDIAKWLYSINTEMDVIPHILENICINGYLEIAQILHEVQPSLNINGDYKEAFKSACQYGHLDIIKWLQSIGFDIYVDGYIFKNSPINVLIWLKTLSN